MIFSTTKISVHKSHQRKYHLPIDKPKTSNTEVNGKYVLNCVCGMEEYFETRIELSIREFHFIDDFSWCFCIHVHDGVAQHPQSWKGACVVERCSHIANVLKSTDIINLFLIYLVSRLKHTLFLLDFHIHFLCSFLFISYPRPFNAVLHLIRFLVLYALVYTTLRKTYFVNRFVQKVPTQLCTHISVDMEAFEIAAKIANNTTFTIKTMTRHRTAWHREKTQQWQSCVLETLTKNQVEWRRKKSYEEMQNSLTVASNSKYPT